VRLPVASLTLLTTFFVGFQSVAHEFWLEPLSYRVAPGDDIQAKTINGEDFSGVEFSYSPRAFEQSGIVSGNTRNTIPGKSGDRPAITVSPAGPGLNILYHASSMSVLTYPNMEKFESFLRGKKLDWGIAAHRARGLSEDQPREAYFRMVKALVAVGDGAGQDTFVGLPYELVAKTNPYTTSGDVTVQLLRSREPVPNYPIYVFRRTNGKVTKLDLKTDGAGNVVVPRGPGGEFMVNAVDLSEPSQRIKDEANAEWQTIWAALTYEAK